VVIKDGEATVKKYKRRNGKIILIPLNDNYEPIELPAEKEGIEFGIFKVIGSYKKYR
jgi:SOS-response transcriptional repressor LexA